MNYSLRNFFIFITIAVSLALVTSPSYAKDEGDKKPKTSKVKKAKKVKAKREKPSKKGEKKGKSARSAESSKGTDSDSSRSGKSGKKSGKSSDESGNNDNKGSDDSKDKDAKPSESDNSSSNNKSKKKKASGSSRRTGSTSNAKKQYKDIIVNLNKADAKTFSHYLVGIGEKRAKAIIAYRKKNGKFKDIKELLKIEGIGEKIFDGLRKNVSLTKGETSAPKGDKSGTKKAKK